MNPITRFSLTLLAAATLGACSSVQLDNNALLQARSEYQTAQANTRNQTLAAAEMKEAGDALARAEAAYARHDSVASVDQLAYLARGRIALASETASRKASEMSVAEAAAARDQMRLAARTREADAATQAAAVATRDAASSQRQSEASQRDAASAQQQAASAQQQAASAQQQAVNAQQQAADAERRSQMLERQLRELDAKKTDRGLVITISDVLFDSGQSQLKSGGMQNLQRLGGFLKDYPQRKALIEGYTDSVGSDGMNQALSARRADAVMTALLNQGVDGTRLSARGYGEAHPVAGNDNAGGRQMNRRVEIVLSDDRGVVVPR